MVACLHRHVMAISLTVGIQQTLVEVKLMQIRLWGHQIPSYLHTGVEHVKY